MTQKCGANKLAKLRELMKSISTSTDGSIRKGIQAFIVHTTDAHQSEYLREHDRRLQFISGFTGSLGTAIITYDKALLWTDGRYFNQALKEFDPPEAWTLMKEPLPETPTRGAWLVSNLPPKSVVGADPNLLSSNEWLTLQNNLNASGHCLLPLYENLVDKVWSKDQPAAVYNAIVPQPLEYTGRTAGEKVRSCLEAMKQNKCTALVFEALDEVAYLLNWRGSDIPYNPVFFAYVILTLEELHLFVNINMVSPEAKEQLVSEGVNPIYHPYEEIHDFLKTIASVSGQKIWIPSDSSYSIVIDCGTAGKYSAITPIALMKVIKTDVEIKGMKAAHVRDSVALVKYFAWLEDKVQNTDECITEISGAERLLRFRQEQELFVGPSFTTISSVGPHGAIIHYQPTPETDVQITDKEMYLCDSGAQYKDGTTDITRTWHFGTPTNYERECFTRVFKGQSHLSTLIFPSKTKGNILHSLTRESLWSAGLDFLHGTGHGVGSYLNVHELLVLISWKPNPHDPGLQAGMFISNEPGYYEDNNFGIRLENIELIVEAKTPYNFMNNKFVTFETVSLVPIQKSLLDTSLLTDPEIEYLNNYHAKCYKVLQPFLQGAENAQALQWLEKVTQPLYREMKTQK